MVRRAIRGPQLAHLGPSFYEQFDELLQLARYVSRNEIGRSLLVYSVGTNNAFIFCNFEQSHVGSPVV